MSFGPGTKTTAEAARQAYQMSVIEVGVAAVEQTPPTSKTRRADPHREVGDQNDTVHAVVAACQKILLVIAELILHVPPCRQGNE